MKIQDIVNSLAMVDVKDTDETEQAREWEESIDEAVDDYQGRELEPIADMQM